MARTVTAAAGGRAGDRTVRRRLVVATYLGYAAFAALLLGRGRADALDLAAVPLGAALALATLLALGRLLRAAHALANDPDAHLDERQRAVADRAYLVAYRAVATLFLLVSSCSPPSTPRLPSTATGSGSRGRRRRCWPSPAGWCC